MEEDGRLELEGQSVTLERAAFMQLAQLGGFGLGARYLAERCDPALRAINVNRHFQGQGQRMVSLRMRQPAQGIPQIYAAVTPSYTVVDTDRVLETMTPALRDAHTELCYDGQGVRGSALWMPDSIVDLAAGDVFKTGVRIETDDTGRGRIRIAGVVWRNRCLNLIILGVGSVETCSAVHRGDPQRILDRVREGVLQARDKVGDFLETRGRARQLPVEPEPTFRRWLDRTPLQLQGLRSERDREGVVTALMRA